MWDFWFADDGEQFHMFYLHAPKTLGDPDLRHRNARIGHATSADLVAWTDHGAVLEPGGPEDFDASATWTGCVIQGPDTIWRMYYTGSRFLSEDSATNVESIGVAKSADLHTWVKSAGPVVVADAQWYETLGSSDWPEEAWRDPWVFQDPDNARWHMIITARAKSGSRDPRDRGVLGHATSLDLNRWEVQEPLSEPGAGFVHLEVPQVITMAGRSALLFSCDTPALAGHRAAEAQRGGIWILEIDDLTGPFDPSKALLLAGDDLYSGRLIQDRNKQWVLMAFENRDSSGSFVGVLSDPMPVNWEVGQPIMSFAADSIGPGL